MVKYPLDSPENSFSELAQHIVSCVDVLAQKIAVHDCGPILDRLRQGVFIEPPQRVTDTDPSLEDATARLAEYDRSIVLVEEALLKLKGARNSFGRFKDLQMSLRAPVRRLPEDALVGIFSLYIEDYGARWGSKECTYFLTLSREHRISSPNFTLSHICSFWRRIVFSRPIFWSSFALDLRGFKEIRGESQLLPVLAGCLSRSADAPLNLRIKLDSDDNNLICEDAFSLFFEQAARWEHLDLVLFNRKAVSQFISWLQPGGQPPILSSLKHLHLGGGFGDNTEKISSLLLMLIRNSHLETLGTGIIKVPWSDLFQCDFSSLTKLETGELSDVSVGRLLGQMHSLEECNLSVTFDYTADVDSTSTTYYSNLGRLTVSLDGCPIDAWQSLRTPRLSYLSLKAEDDATEEEIEAVSSMLVRSKAVLRELKLGNIFVHEAIDVINAHPSVTDISLTGLFGKDNHQAYPGDFFSRLTIVQDENEMILGPNLQSLSVEVRRTANVDSLGNSLSDADSLPSGVSALRNFSIKMFPKYEGIFDFITASLASSVACGLKLQLSVY
ncbi:hypothetical protein GYMLUDRAFT_970388 [Collybiopsis luxurians FD-317 M1]|uniref:F-box domain-containing protein n=1 Tax=Collybiopsis luxurians FD-317 M1 TaxID=944289 RepID=A0A0D0BRP7_9AGAR|nr:hypothetical protein GYMLUDRAFT_970388 [Collybiopsis luxurians FD-317 M1]